MDDLELYVTSTNHEFLFSYSDSCGKTKMIQEIVRCILVECMDQLCIMMTINGQHTTNTYNGEPVEYLSIEDRYMGAEDHAEFRINSVTSNYDKLAKDINMILTVIEEGYDEVTFGGTCHLFRKNSDILQRMLDDEDRLVEEKKKNEKYIEELRNQCEEERLYNIRTIEETNAKIQKLRFEVEDALAYGRYENGYFSNWEKSRQEQNEMACRYKENHYQSIINDMTNKIELENRCHMELEAYLEEDKNDCLDGIQYWMKHYDEEIERRESEMLTLRTDLEKLTDEHERREALYKKQTEEINAWLEYKKIMKEKEDQRKLELWAALKIQAWWRGVMYRRKLGPYRVKKGKGKGKGKGKKKGK